MSEEQAAKVIRLRHRLRAMVSIGSGDRVTEQTLEALRVLAEELEDPSLMAEHLRWRTFFAQSSRRAA